LKNQENDSPAPTNFLCSRDERQPMLSERIIWQGYDGNTQSAARGREAHPSLPPQARQTFGQGKYSRDHVRYAMAPDTVHF